MKKRRQNHARHVCDSLTANATQRTRRQPTHRASGLDYRASSSAAERHTSEHTSCRLFGHVSLLSGARVGGSDLRFQDRRGETAPTAVTVLLNWSREDRQHSEPSPSQRVTVPVTVSQPCLPPRIARQCWHTPSRRSGSVPRARSGRLVPALSSALLGGLTQQRQEPDVSRQ